MKYVYIGIAAFLLLATVAIGFLLFPTVWVEKREFLGVQVGMNRRDVLEILSSRRITEFIPALARDKRFATDDIHEIEAVLDSVHGICIDDLADSISLKTSFDPESRAVRQKYSSLRTFDWPLGDLSVDDFIELLTSALERDGRLRVAVCLPDAQWVNTEVVSDDELSYLNQYATWSFNEPKRQMPVKLTFSGQTLSHIEYGWAAYAPP